ncbi:M64 family metallopeptidase [Hoylesella enoeca]|uniref:IgA Peptidase M64 n=1 Tax=Hoylesella enoeca TaxID=76123 RepID=A0A0S2KHN1_9BACT|nr:M64 family metallopeptidase [Hoylesella enoeca]ALO47836.1 hypothetical protein AS203_00900 [Hoylesella enoeca]
MMKKKYFLYLFLALFVASCNESDNEDDVDIRQEQRDDITSLDGKVTTLQTATVGSGYNLILMGDGFTADQIKDGTYARVMEKARDNFFSLEPVKSLRAYFNVYAVQKVSLSRNLNGSTALASALNSSNTVCGYFSDDNLDYKTLIYASAVPGFKEENSVISVVMNTERSGGITFYHGWNSQLACAYTTLYGGLDSNYFRYTLVHETAGHGIGKLDDEYDTRHLTIDDYGRSYFEYGHSLGWVMNVSLTDDKTKAPWAEFLADTRYASEGLGLYEGGGARYATGVWRPTETSIMRVTDTESTSFNAPSRRAIYNQIMKVTTGKTPTYEEFVTFDLAHR